MAKDEVKNFGSPIRPRRNEVDGLQVDLFEVQAVRNHQHDAVLFAGIDHPLTFLDGDGHRCFAQHVHAGLRCANGVLGVERVGESDVDGVHLLEALIVFVVRVRAFEPVLLESALRLAGSSLTTARREFRLAWVNAGSTAACAM